MCIRDRPNATPWMVMDGRSNCVAGAQVVLYEQVTCDEQQWQIRKNANGSYCLSPKKDVYKRQVPACSDKRPPALGVPRWCPA